MNAPLWAYILFEITLGASGIYLLVFAVWGFTSKRPLIISTRQDSWILFLFYFLGLVSTIISLFEHSGSYFLVFLAIISTVCAFLIWQSMTGCIVCGARNETFHMALVYALNKLGAPFQEADSKLRLTDMDADLQVMLNSSTSIAQIRIKPWKNLHYLKKITKVMKDYYKRNPVDVDKTSFVIFFLMSIGLIDLASMFGFGLFDILRIP